MTSLEKNQPKSKESNSRGGARKGAGRKVGSATKRTREIADAAAETGETPLEVMLRLMRRQTAHEDAKIELAREAMVFEAAKAAAPYMHPRLNAVEHTGANGGPIQAEFTVTFEDGPGKPSGTP